MVPTALHSQASANNEKCTNIAKVSDNLKTVVQLLGEDEDILPLPHGWGAKQPIPREAVNERRLRQDRG